MSRERSSSLPNSRLGNSLLSVTRGARPPGTNDLYVIESSWTSNGPLPSLASGLPAHKSRIANVRIAIQAAFLNLVSVLESIG